MRFRCALLTAAVACTTGGTALANGAFPNSETVLAPVAAPGGLLVATNFGVVVSADGGSTWTWRCELPNSRNGAQYQLGAPPLDPLYAIAAVNATAGLVYSDDLGCSWRVAGGGIAGAAVTDAFPDPTNPVR